VPRTDRSPLSIGWTETAPWSGVTATKVTCAQNLHVPKFSSATDIEICRGIAVIPCGEPKYAVGAGSWDGAVESFKVFAQCELSWPGSQIVKLFANAPEEPDDVLPVLVSLTPAT